MLKVGVENGKKGCGQGGGGAGSNHIGHVAFQNNGN